MISTLLWKKHFISDGCNILIGKNQKGTLAICDLDPCSWERLIFFIRIYDLACGSGEVTLFFDKLGQALTEAEQLPADHITTEATDPYTYKYAPR